MAKGGYKNYETYRQEKRVRTRGDEDYMSGKAVNYAATYYFELFYHTLDEENHFNAIQLKIGLNIMEQKLSE